MPYLIKDRIKVSSTSTGTGSFVLGSAETGFNSFSSIGSNTTYYCITNSIDWEVGLGTYNTVNSTLTRDEVLESSNNNTFVNWSSGKKLVFGTFPAEATEGTVPTSDNSSIGTDLVAWNNLKKELINRKLTGSVSSQNIVSTYSLVFTNISTTSHIGAVLDGQGFIYFIPTGQGIGEIPVFNTNTKDWSQGYYLLSYDLASYEGGVLDGNGDIHLVPNSTGSGVMVGQKFSTLLKVSSTYSLVYTTNALAYAGGVLAPNGDIHFIPHAARVGQKVSASGTVSTYSLVYTTSFAGYRGGVLAPNGDIHFVPHSAAVGQKVSASGTVSTYSLVYTTNRAYAGGVLDSKGNIHFVPAWATVGQKVSMDGIVSTYPLLYSRTSGNFSSFGGVLAPNGEVYFIPNNAAVGQKVSVDGVVSTFSLIHGTSAFYYGGVLAPDGDIYFVAGLGPSTNRNSVEKIQTGIEVPIGYAVSPFFNKGF